MPFDRRAALAVAVVCLGVLGCTGGDDAESAPTTGSTSPTTAPEPVGQPVSLELGFCGIRPLVLDGVRWVAVDADFGSGAPPAPPTYSGHGTFTPLTKATAHYEDDAGLELDFIAYTGEGTVPPSFCR